MLGDIFIVLFLDAILSLVIWIATYIVWNNIVREELRIKSKQAWTYLLGITIVIANAMAIANLWH